MIKKIFTIIVYIFALIGFFLTTGYVAVRFGLTNTAGIIDNQRSSFVETSILKPTSVSCIPWNENPEWAILNEAIKNDYEVINRAAATAGVPARLIVMNLTTEQLRLFFSEREYYKKFFEPLKILGSQTQFSWGVMGIKEDTAIQIENNLKSTSSPYYLGPEYEHILDFKTLDVKQERFARMTDSHDHYYSYLYAGLYLKEIMTQWERAGFDISDKPDVLATLYNIGFKGSNPNNDPQSGGAEIIIGNQVYSFGSLSREFYDSNELIQEFPR